MPHFVYDDTALFFPKTNLNPLPPGADPTQYVQSLDWNTLNQAVEDIKTQLRGAVWYGFEKQAVDPAPVGITDYLWADVAGDLFFHTGGGDVQLTAGGGTVNSASNVGIGAGSVGIFKQLTGGDLEFKGIRPSSTKISVVDAVGTDDVDLDVVEANIVHQNLSGAGTNTHATIDAQLPSAVQKTDLGQLDGAAQGTVWFANSAGRVTRLAPGTAGQVLVTQGAAADAVWGDGRVALEDESVSVTGTPHTILDFVGAGVTVTNAGAGKATITIPGGGGGGNTLDGAYDQGGPGVGRTINATDGAVLIQNPDIETDNTLEVTKLPGGLTTGHALFVQGNDSLNDFVSFVDVSSLGTGSSPRGFAVANQTPAAAGATNEQYSPLIGLIAGAHDNTDPRTWTWALQNQTVNVTAADEAHLHFLVDDNGLGFVSRMSLSNAGILSVPAGFSEISVDYLGTGDAIFVDLSNGTDTGAQALVITEDNTVARTNNLVDITRGLNSTGHAMKVLQGGSGYGLQIVLGSSSTSPKGINIADGPQAYTGASIAVTGNSLRVAPLLGLTQRGTGTSALDITMETSLDSSAINIDEDAAARTASMVTITRAALSTGNGIDITMSGGSGIVYTGDKSGLDNGVAAAAIGMLLQNSSNAGAGAQQHSPIFVLEGQGWKTDATAATQEVQMGLQVQPVQGAANPTGELHFMSRINGAASFTSLMYLTSGGSLILNSETVAVLGLSQQWTGNQYSSVQALTDAATVAVDASLSNVFELTATGAVGATRTLGNPTNVVAGMSWIVVYNQDGTGGRQLTFDTNYDFGDEGTPDFSSDVANESNIISFVALTASQIAASVLTGFN